MCLLNWLSWLGDRLAHFLTYCSGWLTDFLQHVQSKEANWFWLVSDTITAAFEFSLSLTKALQLCVCYKQQGHIFCYTFCAAMAEKDRQFKCCWNGVKKSGSLWGLFLHQGIEYQLPKFRGGELLADISAAADSYFPSAYTTVPVWEQDHWVSPYSRQVLSVSGRNHQ